MKKNHLFLQSGQLVLATIIFLIGSSPATFAQDALWRTYFNSAQKSYQESNFQECENLLQSAANSARKYDDSLITCYYLGRVNERLGRSKEAEGYYRTVLENLGPKIWATLRLPDGTVDWEQSESIESEHIMSSQDFFKRFRHHKQPLHAPLAKPITTVDVLTDLGLLMQEEKRYQEAEQMFRQALMLSELRTESIQTIQPKIMQRLAKLYATQNRKAESEALYKQLEDARTRSLPGFDQLVTKNIKDINRLGKNHVLTATRLNNLALFCVTHGDYTNASALYVRALENCDKPTKNNDVAVIMRNYSDLLEAMGRTEESKRFLREANGLGDVKALPKKVVLKSPTVTESAVVDK